MKTLFTASNLFLVIFCLVCAGCVPTIDHSEDGNWATLTKVVITDKTDVHYYKNGQTTPTKTITDPEDIKAFRVELDSMKKVQNMDIKYNMGNYDMILCFKDGTSEEAGLIYTIYDGVVFYNYNTNKSYKNNHMEELVRSYF
jgi:hypothetical protein